MRILFLNWRDQFHPNAGGAEVFVHEVARRWVEWGDEVTLFSQRISARADAEIVSGVSIERGGSRLGVYSAAKAYFGEHRDRFDLVIDSVNTRPFLTPRFVGDTPAIALIYQVCREIWWYESPLPVALLGRFVLEPRWLKLYESIPSVTISRSSEASLREYGLRELHVIAPGVTRPNVLNGLQKAERPTMIFVGRLTANKRPQHAIRTLSLVRRALPDAQLWVLGSGPMETRLRRMAGKGVTFFGRVSEEEKFELMCRAHVLIATSVREGWGLNVSEAASVGTAAVAYDVPGLRDSVINGETGMLSRSNPHGLAEAVTSAFGESLARMGANAEGQAKRLDWDITARELKKLANEIAGAGS